MNNSNDRYTARLKDPRWQKLRLQKLDEAKWQCEICGDTEETLNVHHIHYVSGRAPWDYPAESLQVLCETCHTITHMDHKKVEACCVKYNLAHQPQPRKWQCETLEKIAGIEHYEEHPEETTPDQMQRLRILVEVARMAYRRIALDLEADSKSLMSGNPEIAQSGA